MHLLSSNITINTRSKTFDGQSLPILTVLRALWTPSTCRVATALSAGQLHVKWLGLEKSCTPCWLQQMITRIAIKKGERECLWQSSRLHSVPPPLPRKRPLPACTLYCIIFDVFSAFPFPCGPNDPNTSC